MSMSENICNFASQSVNMFDIEPFKIDLRAVNQEVEHFEFTLTDEYFEAIKAPDIHKGNLSVELTLRKMAGSFMLSFHIVGTVVVQCDRCLDELNQPIETDERLVVRLGTEYSDEDDQVTVPEDEGIIDTSWFIYEFIDLSIPIQHVHAPGKCNHAMMRALNNCLVTRSNEATENDPIDPRWVQLEKLKTIIKD